VSGWTLVQTASDRTFTFPDGTLFGPGDVVVVGRDAALADFEAFWGVTLGANVTYFDGDDDWPNVNGGETYELDDQDGAAVDGPTIALDEGHCYARVSSELDPGDPASWTALDAAPGQATPGSGPDAPGEPGLHVTELCDATGTGAYVYEFVELTFE